MEALIETSHHKGKECIRAFYSISNQLYLLKVSEISKRKMMALFMFLFLAGRPIGIYLIRV